MKLIKPSTEILTNINGEQILKDIEIAARTCYKSEDKIEYTYSPSMHPTGTIQSPDEYAKSARALIKMLIAKGHEAMLEFGNNITVKFICDRGVSHELVRHRLCSFAQESTRYCNYGNDENIQFIDIKPFMNEFQYTDWINAIEVSENMYLNQIQLGSSAQIARSVLPNSVKTEINVSTNIRDWRHIFKLRTSKAAHPQMRELMIPLLEEFKSKIPILFDDIVSE